MIPVFYSTSEGQTARIARRIASALSRGGFRAEAVSIESAETVDWAQVPIFVLGASVHMGAHDKAAVAFTQERLRGLDGRPSVFFSVSLTAMGKDAESRTQAETCKEDFLVSARWRPELSCCVAGRLAYTQYPWWKRLLMRSIARSKGAPTDTSRDHEFTDWAEVDALAADIGELVRTHPRSAPEAGIQRDAESLVG